MLAFLGATGDLLLVVLGFSLIVFVHELGHFFAAKWAGVRVEAFAMGFGRAVLAFRKGMGLRVGSTEPEYRRLLADSPQRAAAISPTEYRLNWLFFGGYVRMLGQNDMEPGGHVDHPESFTTKPVWKRMIIISAGVAMNIVFAAALFVIVFMAGLRTEPATIGAVMEGAAAGEAKVVSGWVADDPGLKPGDRVVRVGGHAPSDFSDFALEIAMSRKGAPVEIVVERQGSESPVVLSATPREGAASGLLEIGALPEQSTRLFGAPGEPRENIEIIRRELAAAGLDAVPPGSTLVEINGRPADSPRMIEDVVRVGGDAPVALAWVTPRGERLETSVAARATLETAVVALADTRGLESREVRVPHLLGLTPAMMVTDPGLAARFGLSAGDVFARIGGVEWPDIAGGIAEVRRHTGREIALRVLRDGQFVDLSARVGREGTIGFTPGVASSELALVTGTIERSGGALESAPSAASRLDIPPGATILEADGRPVTSFDDLRAAILRAERTADGGATIDLAVRLMLGGTWGQGPVERMQWSIPRDDLDRVAALGWEFPVAIAAFRPAEIVLKASGPIEALSMGVQRTHRVMLKTYLTLVRLFQGSVKVEHLKGPVGIAHLGTLVADRGMIHLLFFMGLISVNLAVVNFLPLPIVDGGHFVFLLAEQITGRPVSNAVQNAAGLVGLALIVTMFLIVTYNDIAGLFGG